MQDESDNSHDGPHYGLIGNFNVLLSLFCLVFSAF